MRCRSRSNWRPRGSKCWRPRSCSADSCTMSCSRPPDGAICPNLRQTVNATGAWSYELLGPNERRMFRRLGVLPGRFPIEAAAAVLAGREESSSVSDEALGAAAGLIDKNLLLRSETSAASRPLYDMLETVRAYAALELITAGERDDAMEGLVRYSIADQGRRGVGGANSGSSRRGLRTHTGDTRRPTITGQPHRTRGTRGACPPGTGSVGCGIRSGPSDVHRIAAEGHRSRRVRADSRSCLSC